LLKSPLNRNQKDQLNTILKSSEILLTIINDILDFSKIEAGKLVLDYTTVNLQDVVDDVLTMLAPSAHEKNLDLAALVYADVPPQIYGDPLRLKQVLTNLINNAIKFTQRGEVMVRVMLEENDKQGRMHIRFTVSDTGVGLSRLQQQNLFTPFSQADASTARRYGGTGLGLVISRRLVDQMGGKIGVESELGKGATFWVDLPVTLDNADPAEDFTTPLILKNERIIYLEHQEKTALVVESMLNLWGAQVERAQTMAELIEKIMAAQQKNSGYAMALIGLSQSQLGSTPYAQSLRSLEYKLDCRTLLLVPTPNPAAEIPAFFSDASAILTKPPTRRRMADTVMTLLKGRLNQPQKTVDLAQNSPRQNAPIILAVDDNTANLKLVVALLNELKMKCEGVASGYEALRAVRRQSFDLVFMDVQMPGMDGIETTAKIREIEGAERHTPIVALTAHALAEEKQLLMKSGFDDYLTKPVGENQLQQMIERHTGYRIDQPVDKQVEANPSAIKPSSRTLMSTCVDVPAGIRLAGGKHDLAEELFSMLLESLPEARRTIEVQNAKAAVQNLLEEVHKLHGATRYCGVPLLRQASSSLENALKRGQQPLQPLVDGLLAEIDRIEYWAERNDWQREFRKANRST
jgi:two-component system sensor histidine kinase BarA